jgi:enoyl-CoA hydratase/carnithine racemase
MSDLIRLTRNGAVAAVTIDRPTEGNLLDTALLRAFTARLKEAAASDAKVILIRTAGADFCRGRDPKGGPPNPTPLMIRDQVLQPILDVYGAINGAPQPVVCAVQGAALGFGCAMATACDITIAADGATFKLPELAHNLPPTLAIWAMMAKVPRKALTFMVYTQAEIDARTALSLGIVSAVVPKAELDARVDQTVKALTARSAQALTAVKDYLRTAPLMDPAGGAAYGGTLIGAVLTSQGK